MPMREIIMHIYLESNQFLPTLHNYIGNEEKCSSKNKLLCNNIELESSCNFVKSPSLPESITQWLLWLWYSAEVTSIFRKKSINIKNEEMFSLNSCLTKNMAYKLKWVR